MVALLVVSVVIIYLWPYIEGVLILLPIPDPKTVKDKAKNYFKAVLEKVSK